MFLANDELAKAFNDMANSYTLKTGLAMAYSELSLQAPTAEELSGINRFVRIFLNIGQKDGTERTPSYKSIATALPVREQPPTPKK